MRASSIIGDTGGTGTAKDTSEQVEIDVIALLRRPNQNRRTAHVDLRAPGG
jgi:hypothetical protein